MSLRNYVCGIMGIVSSDFGYPPIGGMAYALDTKNINVSLRVGFGKSLKNIENKVKNENGLLSDDKPTDLLNSKSNEIDKLGIDSINLSDLCQNYGGGGHENAAALILPIKIFNDLTSLVKIKPDEKKVKAFLEIGLKAKEYTDEA